MPPVVSIVGRAKSGKTTLLEKLIRELTSRGYRVATIKHTRHERELDIPEKDTWRHIQAGSLVTALASPNGTVVFKPASTEPALEEIVKLIGDDYDIILTEGFKHGSAPKIEVHRKENGAPLEGLTRLVAIATNEPLAADVRQIPLEDITALADLIEKDFILPARKPSPQNE